MNNFLDNDNGQRHVIDVTLDEAGRLAKLQTLVNRKFVGAEKTLDNWAQLKDELTTRAAELGFVVDINLVERGGNWYPTCDIVGRTDTVLQRILDEYGPDIERKAAEAGSVTDGDLKAAGIDKSILTG